MTNEAKDQVPDWAKVEGERIAKEAVREAMRDPLMPMYIPMAPMVARALLAAQRMGIERAAKVVGQRVALASEIAPEAAAALFVALPDAIRQLGDTP